MASSPIKIHPDNPRLLEFRGKPLAPLCATEHYGAVLNRPFDFEAYLREHAAKKQTLTRLFLLFRELQSANNPYSTCKPESPDFIAPWPRTGPGRSLDGEPRYDLSRWNEQYFERLHRFFRLSGELGIVVEATIFSNSYNDTMWSLNPLHAPNNLQGVGAVPFNQYLTGGDAALWEQQQNLVRKVVTELNGYDNFYFEICNEPGTFDVGSATQAEIDGWQKRVALLVRETEAGLPNRHLIFGAQAFAFAPGFHQPNDDAIAWPEIDAMNVHPLPDTSLGGRTYDMGGFMSKQLHLQEFRDFTLAVAAVPRPCVHDEDNIASCHLDFDGWTIHRKRAWTALLCGAGYNVIDFSITIHTPQGTPAAREHLRSWLKHLSEFVHSLDLARARPVGDWLLQKPEHLVESTLAVEGEEYPVYLADARELPMTPADAPTGAGSPMGGEVRFSLPPGQWWARWFSPATGAYLSESRICGSEETRLALPEFTHDIALRLTRVQKDA